MYIGIAWLLTNGSRQSSPFATFVSSTWAAVNGSFLNDTKEFRSLSICRMVSAPGEPVRCGAVGRSGLRPNAITRTPHIEAPVVPPGEVCPHKCRFGGACPCGTGARSTIGNIFANHHSDQAVGAGCVMQCVPGLCAQPWSIAQSIGDRSPFRSAGPERNAWCETPSETNNP